MALGRKIYTILKENDDNLSTEKRYEMRCLSIFQHIDSLGNYSDMSWFTTLEKNNLIKFVRDFLKPYTSVFFPSINPCLENIKTFAAPVMLTTLSFLLRYFNASSLSGNVKFNPLYLSLDNFSTVFLKSFIFCG